jgi:hypothetical protein
MTLFFRRSLTARAGAFSASGSFSKSSPQFGRKSSFGSLLAGVMLARKIASNSRNASGSKLAVSFVKRASNAPLFFPIAASARAQ